MASNKARRIFFWVLVVLFIATAPIIIFYARGYRFNFQQGIFIYAGSIAIKSNPQKVDIFINGDPSPKKKTNLINNSYHVDGIRPGEYLLEVKAPGYVSWSKKITVHSGVSTEFWNVLLAKNDYEKTTYPARGLEKFYSSPNREFIAYSQYADQEFLVKLLNIQSATAENIFSSLNYRFPEEEFEIYQENIEWSPQSDKIIIPVEENGMKHYFIVDITEIKDIKTVNLKDLTKTEKIKNVRWDSERKNSVFYMFDNDLYRVDINNSEIIPIAENIASYDISSSDIYYFKLSDGLIYKADAKDGTIISKITASPPAGNDSFNYRIIAYDEERVAIFNESDGLFVYNKGKLDTYFRKLSPDINGLQFSDDGKKLLFWNNFEIASYFVREWDVQPQRQENEIQQITRFSQKIRNVQWSKDYEHIIFTVGTEIKIIELDHRDHKNLTNLTTLANDNPLVLTDFSANKIYFTNRIDDQSDLFSINFPEPTGFLGN